LKTAVVIPCYRVRRHIEGVLAGIGPDVDRIFVVDDCCPEGTGRFVEETVKDPRVRVIVHQENRGVGGAMVTGYRAALEDGAEIVVKLDGDGQMDPALIPQFTTPLRQRTADYAKGNRFFHPDYLTRMPGIRVLGNTLLSFANKLISGYWDLMDPANGFTAIHRTALRSVPLDKIDTRYFFESDMLFRLNVARAVVVDTPMRSVYAGEKSNLCVGRVLLVFPWQYLNRFAKRLLFNYFLRDFNLGTLALVFGTLLMAFGTTFGLYHWIGAHFSGTQSTAGTVMVAALPVILGFQLLLFFLQFDILSVPRKPLSADDPQTPSAS
jgi:glycosyltransferase involved in cell wall biosynthesis